MRRVQVSLKKSLDDSYDIEIEKGLFKRIASDLRMKRFAEQYVVVTDAKVGRLYAAGLLTALKREKLFLGKVTVPAGEESKSLEKLKEIAEDLLELGAHRHVGIIALGGGMIGDLAGFTAATFMRGLPYVQIPTTLLAMVDSSVGGKVGVDLPSGKNLVGAFWQPKKVYIDPELLGTLPEKQWKAGLGEAVKYGAIKDRILWEFFEQHVAVWNKDPEKFLPSEWKLVEEMIERCVRIKAEVVMKDEKEGNLRQILNYGHTFGHVIELMSDFKVLHGEAVATGMRTAGALAVKLRHMPTAELEKQNKLLDMLKIGKTKTKGLIKDFVQHMKKDKKGAGDLKVVLVDRLGRCHQQLGKFAMKVDEKIVREVLKEGGWVDDREVAVTPPGPLERGNISTPTSWSNNYESPTLYSATPETDLQRRLREMRERRERDDREPKSGFQW